jgi:hypothetical protein
MPSSPQKLIKVTSLYFSPTVTYPERLYGVTNHESPSSRILVPNPFAQGTHQFLTRMHRVRIRSWCVCSAYFEWAVLCARISSWCVCSVHSPVPNSYAHVASVPYAYAQYLHQFLTCMLSIFWRDLCKFGIFTLMLSIRERNWCVCSEYALFLTRVLRVYISSWPICTGYASVPDAYAQHILKGLCSVHAFVPDAYAQCTHQFLTHMLTYASVPDAHAQCTHQFLMRMLSTYISSLHACSACFEGTFANLEFLHLCWAYPKEDASVPNPCAQGTHQFLTPMHRVRISSSCVC